MREADLDSVHAPEKSLHLNVDFVIGLFVIVIVEEAIENAAARMVAGAARTARTARATATPPVMTGLVLGGVALIAKCIIIASFGARTAALIVRYVILTRFVVRAVVEIAHSCSFRFTGFCQTHGKEARIFLENE